MKFVISLLAASTAFNGAEATSLLKRSFLQAKAKLAKMPHYDSLGCWKDSESRVLGYRAPSEGQPYMKGQCAEHCKAKNYGVFAVQAKGECFCGGPYEGREEYEGYKKLGEGGADSCFCDKPMNGEEFSNWAICVYLIEPPVEPVVIPEMAAEDKCPGQARFDVLMCKSHTCNKSAAAWSTKTCQTVQKMFPTCRCSNWAPQRKSFTGGDFAGKGGLGDKGDYKAGGEFASAPASSPAMFVRTAEEDSNIMRYGAPTETSEKQLESLCSCASPGKGQAFSCTDGTTSACAAYQVCSDPVAWVKGSAARCIEPAELLAKKAKVTRAH